MYPEEDLGPAKERLTLFLEQYWGGPTTYSQERGHPRLRMRHAPFHVNPDARDRWLAHMRAAVDELELPPLHEATLWDYLQRAALRHGQHVRADRHRPVRGRPGRGIPAPDADPPSTARRTELSPVDEGVAHARNPHHALHRRPRHRLGPGRPRRGRARRSPPARRVMIVDQEPRTNLGGQAWWSFGGLFFIDSPEQRRMGIKDSLELARQDWFGTAGFDRDEDAWPRRWAEAYLQFAARGEAIVAAREGRRLLPRRRLGRARRLHRDRPGQLGPALPHHVGHRPRHRRAVPGGGRSGRGAGSRHDPRPPPGHRAHVRRRRGHRCRRRHPRPVGRRARHGHLARGRRRVRDHARRRRSCRRAASAATTTSSAGSGPRVSARPRRR